MTILKIHKLILGCALSSFVIATPLTGFAAAADQPNAPVNAAHTIWASMSQSYGLPVHNDKAVNSQIAKWQKNPEDLKQILIKAAPLISYVFAKTKEAGLPAELALLPIVESNYDPEAKSSVGARGIWQFMPGTAVGFGLKKNAVYDGCKDVVASTHAALHYLDSLHHQFNDWTLALAAYNWGPGNIAKLVKKLHSTDIGCSKKLPTQTQEYEPKLLALAQIIKNPARYHMQLPNVSAEPKVAAVQVGPNVNLVRMAKEKGISVDDMHKLNPGYANLATASIAPNTLLIPAEKAPAVKHSITVVATNAPAVSPVSKYELLSSFTLENHSGNWVENLLRVEV